MHTKQCKREPVVLYGLVSLNRNLASEKILAEALLCMLHCLSICGTIMGQYAMYIAGVLPFHPGVITIYIPHHQQNRSTDISIVMQFQRTLAFSFESLDFLLLTDYTTPEDIYYAVRFGVETVTVRLVLINSDKPCGPRTNLDLVHFMWNTYTYFFTNYAIVMLQLSPEATKVLYTHHYMAEIGGGDSRTCMMCSDADEDPRTLNGLQRHAPNKCSCTVHVRQPLSLKSAASKIVFGIHNLSKFCFDKCKTYSEYVIAARHIPTQYLVPSMEFPNTLFMSYTQYDNPSLWRFHERCSLAVRVQSSGEWPTYTQRQFRTYTQFDNLLSYDNYTWCSFCEKNSFYSAREESMYSVEEVTIALSAIPLHRRLIQKR
jgi:hypothetical protein